jgi:hypothetical protein
MEVSRQLHASAALTLRKESPVLIKKKYLVCPNLNVIDSEQDKNLA